MFKKLLSVSLLLSASLSVAMDQDGQIPQIFLGSISNQIVYAMGDGHVSCHMNSGKFASIDAGETHHMNKELFALKAGQTLPSSKTLTFNPHHPLTEGFRSYTLKLEMQAAALKITKDFGDKQARPEETHPLEAGKKYLLNVTVQPGDDTVVAELVEDNN
jgi:hypothetical protein